MLWKWAWAREGEHKDQESPVVIMLFMMNRPQEMHLLPISSISLPILWVLLNFKNDKPWLNILRCWIFNFTKRTLPSFKSILLSFIRSHAYAEGLASQTPALPFELLPTQTLSCKVSEMFCAASKKSIKEIFCLEGGGFVPVWRKLKSRCHPQAQSVFPLLFCVHVTSRQVSVSSQLWIQDGNAWDLAH